MLTDEQHNPASLIPFLPNLASFYNHELSHNEPQKGNVGKEHLYGAGLDKTDSHLGVSGTVSYSGMEPLGMLLEAVQSFNITVSSSPCANIDVICVPNNATSGLISSEFKVHVRFTIIGGPDN